MINGCSNRWQLSLRFLETPLGSREDELGGSASYGGFSAAFHNRKNSGNGVALVGVVGQDFKSSTLNGIENQN